MARAVSLKTLLMLFLTFTTTAIYAQQDSTKLSPDSVIQYRWFGPFRLPRFTVDNKPQTSRQVYARLINYPPSAQEVKEYKKYNNLTYFMAGACIVSLSSALITTGNSNSFKNTSTKILFGVGCGFLIPEFIFAVKRNRHFKRSFELYNQRFQQ